MFGKRENNKHSKHDPVINSGNVLTREEVIEKADKKFSDHKDKTLILEKLNAKLDSINYESEEMTPWINSDGYSAGYYDFFRASSDEKIINHIVDKFLHSLPGVDVGDYQGQILK